jgi:hypothetical protein
MNNALNIKTETGMTVTLSAKTDDRIVDVVEGRVFCRSVAAIAAIQSELRAWGVKQLPGFAVW